MPNGVGQCGIGSTMNAQGQCIGTYYGMGDLPGLLSQISPSPVVQSMVAAGSILATVGFAVFAVLAVATVRGRMENARRMREADGRAANRLYRSYYREFDMAEFGQRIAEV